MVFISNWFYSECFTQKSVILNKYFKGYFLIVINHVLKESLESWN
ncbi:MAG: hypothetical protein ACI8Q1_002426 [Parvicella sp.]|jgi:hypothetical protein